MSMIKLQHHHFREFLFENMSGAAHRLIQSMLGNSLSKGLF